MRNWARCDQCGRPRYVSDTADKRCICLALPEPRPWHETQMDEHPPTVMLEVVDLGHASLPTYKRPDGSGGTITGPMADAWPYPRWIVINGHHFVEQPLDGPWGVTYHCAPARTRLGIFMEQYAEGIASGFPWWPVVVFAWRAAKRRRPVRLP